MDIKLAHDSRSRLFIAYSGGIDSHVLLHLYASDEQLKDKITAVYINHGLQPHAESWGQHCNQICAELGVQFLNLEVNAFPTPGQSPEEAARNARYAALKPLLSDNDVLLVAQHAEDQLETVFLQLFRGSGLKGLSGMPESMVFGKGRLIRPLLDVSKKAIIDYAETNHLKWIEDPSNKQNHYDRNFLRNEILPLLKERWPSLHKTVSRSAKHCADAQGIMAELSDELIKTVINQDNTINIVRLKDYPKNRQVLILRQWVKSLGLKMPSLSVVQRVLDEVVGAQEQAAAPVLLTQGHEIRRYRDKLFCLKLKREIPISSLTWPSKQSFLEISDDTVYELVPSTSGILAETWRKANVIVKFRTGSETIRLPGRAGSHSLKKLFQEAGIPPWQRSTMPLIYLDDQLAAVGEYWIAAAFYAESDNNCFRLVSGSSPIKGNDEQAIVD